MPSPVDIRNVISAASSEFSFYQLWVMALHDTYPFGSLSQW